MTRQTRAFRQDHAPLRAVRPMPEGEDPLEDFGWRMMTTLVRSLEPGPLLESFFLLLREQLALASLSFRQDELDIELELGTAGRHRAEYRVTLGQRPLGHMTLSRDERFSEDDLEQLEYALALLVQPLNNALRYEQAQREARLDPLTGALNRGAMDEVLGRELGLARRHREPFSLLILDVDNFKLFNDRLGHAAGDRVLKALAETLKSACRESDLVFRYAGDEFVIAMPRSDRRGALCMAERLRRAVEAGDFGVPGEDAPAVEISLGVASFRDDDTPDTLLHRADRRLYRAKDEGRNRIGVSPEGI